MKEVRPEVYLDMDGVLADFFAEYAKLAGITSGNYRDVPPAKTDPTLQKMVGTDFFARLPKFPSADQLIRMTIKLFGRYHICSSPLRGDHENTEHQKNVWIKEHLSPPPATIVITPNKAKYAVQKDGTPNILVDDRGSNITAWEAKGGIGIKYQADEDSLQVIVDGFSRARKILKGELEHKPQELSTKNRVTGQVITKSGHNDDHKEETTEAIQNNTPEFDSENYGTWTVQMSKRPIVMGKITGSNAQFVAKVQHRKDKTKTYFGTGNTQGAARDAAFAKTHEGDERSMNPDDFRSFSVDLNSNFTNEYHDSRAGDYFKLTMLDNKPVLVMANPEYYATFKDEIRNLGFKRALNRNVNKPDGTMAAYGFGTTAPEMKKLNLIPNMRYGLQQIHNDSDGNSLFLMVPDTRTLGPKDKQRMPGPGLTIGATEKVKPVGENGEINPRFQQNPIMARESASSGGTSAGSIASSPAAGGWLFGGTVGAPKAKRKKPKVQKR